MDCDQLRLFAFRELPQPNRKVCRPGLLDSLPFLVCLYWTNHVLTISTISDFVVVLVCVSRISLSATFGQFTPIQFVTCPNHTDLDMRLSSHLIPRFRRFELGFFSLVTIYVRSDHHHSHPPLQLLPPAPLRLCEQIVILASETLHTASCSTSPSA